MTSTAEHTASHTDQRNHNTVVAVIGIGTNTASLYSYGCVGLSKYLLNNIFVYNKLDSITCFNILNTKQMTIQTKTYSTIALI